MQAACALHGACVCRETASTSLSAIVSRLQGCSQPGGGMDSIVEGILVAWGRILAGYAPNLSIEITKECPLRCPGCYAFGDDHLGGNTTLRQVHDYKGDALVNEVLRLVRVHRALHLSIVG